MQFITLQIDVSKIDKSRLYKGEKGTYLNAVSIVKDEKDRFGYDGFITESVSKEEKEKGVKGNIIGNAKIISKHFQEEKKKDDLPF